MSLAVELCLIFLSNDEVNAHSSNTGNCIVCGFDFEDTVPLLCDDFS